MEERVIGDMDLVEQTERTIREEKLLQPGDKLVCAVSGGPDSMALAHVLYRLSIVHHYHLIAVNINHKIRGAESDEEAEVVEQFAAELGIPFCGRSIDVPAYVREHGGNTQAVARELRYLFLQETAKEFGAAAIALAHHADDQVETVIMNFLRGTSPSGLTGIQFRRTEKNMELIRPFLRIHKEQLLQYCQAQQIPYRIDSSNANRKYTRNRIRLDIIPQLLEINPKLPEAVQRMAVILREEDDYLDQQTKEVANRILHCSRESCELSRKSFMTEPVALQRRLIKLILTYLAGGDYSSEFAKIESIRLAIGNETPPSMSLQIDAFVRMVRNYDRVEWFPGLADIPQAKDYEYRIEEPGGDLWITQAHALLKIHIEEGCMDTVSTIDDLNEKRFEAWFDMEQLQFPLIIRSRRSGDRIELLGLNGSKKVKDMFIDLKVIAEWRNQVPLIEDQAGRILWIPGIGRSRHALINNHTNHFVRMQLLVDDKVISNTPSSIRM
jgi:tRNA(Ile)-lysidine synthase